MCWRRVKIGTAVLMPLLLPILLPRHFLQLPSVSGLANWMPMMDWTQITIIGMQYQ